MLLVKSLADISSIYLGLKTGWTFGASLFGAILGFAILKPISRLPTYLGGGYFGPKENVCVQSAATAAGSLGLIYASGIPAAYQLGLLSGHPKDDFGRLITFTIGSYSPLTPQERCLLAFSLCLLWNGICYSSQEVLYPQAKARLSVRRRGSAHHQSFTLWP